MLGFCAGCYYWDFITDTSREGKKLLGTLNLLGPPSRLDFSDGKNFRPTVLDKAQGDLF